ncbi:MAG: hypothetical protein WC349_00365 [Patescibacteria group bacterium]|jgi:hypothetical protein
MKVKVLKIFLILFGVIMLIFWFCFGLLFPCDQFIFFLDGERQNSSCACIGKKIDYKSNMYSSPGSYGTKCIGLGIFKIINKDSFGWSF